MTWAYCIAAKSGKVCSGTIRFVPLAPAQLNPDTVPPNLDASSPWPRYAACQEAQNSSMSDAVRVCERKEMMGAMSRMPCV